MDYSCAKFGDCSFSRFGFIVRADRETDRQTDRQTDRHTELHTDAASRYTHASTVGVITPYAPL